MIQWRTIQLVQRKKKSVIVIFRRWKRNVKKHALNAGKAFKNTKERFVHARETGPACGCKLQCFENVSPEERKRILDFFNGLADYNQQNIHLKAMIDSKDIKRVGAHGQHGLADGVKQQKRKSSYVYWVHIRDHNRIKVRQEII